jgi:hypothetical protein
MGRGHDAELLEPDGDVVRHPGRSIGLIIFAGEAGLP